MGRSPSVKRYACPLSAWMRWVAAVMLSALSGLALLMVTGWCRLVKMVGTWSMLKAGWELRWDPSCSSMSSSRRILSSAEVVELFCAGMGRRRAENVPEYGVGRPEWLWQKL